MLYHPEPSPEALVDEPPPATASEESLPPSVEEALATMPPPPAVHRPDRDAESFLDEGNVYKARKK